MGSHFLRHLVRDSGIEWKNKQASKVYVSIVGLTIELHLDYVKLWAC